MLWKTWIDASSKNALPPDFYNNKFKLMMDVMRIDDHTFVDKNGNLKVQNKYEVVTDFNKYGFAGIKKDGKWGVIDQEGHIVQEPIYELKWNMPEFIGKYYRVNAWYGDARFSDKV